MKNIYPYFILLCCVALTLASCKKDEPAPPAPVDASRTVLVYMVANNNLGSSRFDAMDLEEMKTGAGKGYIGDGRLLVYHAPYNADPHLIEITSHGIDTLQSYDHSLRSVSSQRMSAVLSDMARLAPADDYGMVLWSHGTGWIHDGMESTPLHQRSFGEEHGYTMNTSTLAEVISAAKVDFSFLYFDCCYMMSIETLYELRNAVPLIAGSATELPSPGMPYDLNVRYFFAKPSVDLIGAAESTFNYYDAMFGQDRTCTMSVVETAGIARLAQISRTIFEACGGGIPEGYSPQRFMYTSVASCRYFDFLDYMHALCDAAGRQDLAGTFDSTFSEVVTYSAATPKLWNAIDLNRHNGISTYILSNAESSLTGNYNQLSWFDDVASAVKFE